METTYGTRFKRIKIECQTLVTDSELNNQLLKHLFPSFERNRYLLNSKPEQSTITVSASEVREARLLLRQGGAL
jgi:hypothetical protein